MLLIGVLSLSPRTRRRDRLTVVLARLRAGETHEQAVAQTLGSTGVAMTITSVVLVLGFTVLGLATVKSVAYFGVLSAAAMGSALLADLVFMPALLIALRPKL